MIQADVLGLGTWKKGDVQAHPAMEEACWMGAAIR